MDFLKWWIDEEVFLSKIMDRLWNLHFLIESICYLENWTSGITLLSNITRFMTIKMPKIIIKGNSLKGFFGRFVTLPWQIGI